MQSFFFISKLSSHVYCLLSCLFQETNKLKHCSIFEPYFNISPLTVSRHTWFTCGSDLWVTQARTALVRPYSGCPFQRSPLKYYNVGVPTCREASENDTPLFKEYEPKDSGSRVCTTGQAAGSSSINSTTFMSDNETWSGWAMIRHIKRRVFEWERSLGHVCNSVRLKVQTQARN